MLFWHLFASLICDTSRQRFCYFHFHGNCVEHLNVERNPNEQHSYVRFISEKEKKKNAAQHFNSLSFDIHGRKFSFCWKRWINSICFCRCGFLQLMSLNFGKIRPKREAKCKVRILLKCKQNVMMMMMIKNKVGKNPIPSHSVGCVDVKFSSQVQRRVF